MMMKFYYYDALNLVTPENGLIRAIYDYVHLQATDNGEINDFVLYLLLPAFIWSDDECSIRSYSFMGFPITFNY